MATPLELGRVTVVAELPVEDYDEDGRPNIGGKPNLRIEIAVAEHLSLGAQRNALSIARNLLTTARTQVESDIAEWDAEHIGDLTGPEDTEGTESEATNDV